MMSMIKKGLQTLALTTLLASTSIYATDITVGGSTVSVDDRQDPGQGGWRYDINGMDVSWGADNTITVDVFTNFAKEDDRNRTYNNRSRSGQKRNKIIYGDLLIGANNDGSSDFNYAFSLGNLFGNWNTRFSQIERLNQTNGGLYAINGTTSAGQYHGYSRDKGSVFGNRTGSELNGGSSFWSVSDGKFSFSFNVGGIDAFKKATSLSLSWAMSCYNDAVHDTFALTRKNRPPTDVPEPTTVMLMLLALAGIVYSQKKKKGDFSA